MPWIILSPGHQQPCHQPFKINSSLPFMRIFFNYSTILVMWNERKWKYIISFQKITSVRPGLGDLLGFHFTPSGQGCWWGHLTTWRYMPMHLTHCCWANNVTIFMAILLLFNSFANWRCGYNWYWISNFQTQIKEQDSFFLLWRKSIEGAILKIDWTCCVYLVLLPLFTSAKIYSYKIIMNIFNPITLPHKIMTSQRQSQVIFPWYSYISISCNGSYRYMLGNLLSAAEKTRSNGCWYFVGINKKFAKQTKMLVHINYMLYNWYVKWWRSENIFINVWLTGLLVWER